MVFVCAVLTVIFSSVCNYFSLSAMRSTSSIHRRHPILVLLPGIFFLYWLFVFLWLFHPLLWHIVVLTGHPLSYAIFYIDFSCHTVTWNSDG